LYDEDCNADDGLYCDSHTDCLLCYFFDSDFDPSYTCRHQCDWTGCEAAPSTCNCPAEGNYDCVYAHPSLYGLCYPL
jgi:hypothetical protein